MEATSLAPVYGASEPPSSPSVSIPASAAADQIPPSPSSSPSPSPPPGSPSSPPPDPPSVMTPAEAALPPPAPSPSSRRLAVPCWVHEETVALIDAYREKWYALGRRNLRASDWQEVAEDLSRRCSAALVAGTAASSTPKTSVQCRHKVEKLRKRHRSERRKSLQRNPRLEPNSSWIYFREMDNLERDGLASAGAAPGAASGFRRRSPSPAHAPSDDDDDDNEDNEGHRQYNHRRGPGGSIGNTRSLYHLMSNGGSGTPADNVGRLQFTIPKATRSRISRVYEGTAAASPKPRPASLFIKGHEGTRSATEEMRSKLEKQRRRKANESEAMNEMVSALCALGEGFLRTEQRKMETSREMEKMRMEMELKRTELILDSHRQIVHAFLEGFRSRKRTKVTRHD